MDKILRDWVIFTVCNSIAFGGMAYLHYLPPIKENLSKDIEKQEIQQRKVIYELITSGREVQYYIKAEKPGDCKLRGLCDFNNDGWYSKGEMERVIYNNDITSRIKLEPKYHPPKEE